MLARPRTNQLINAEIRDLLATDKAFKTATVDVMYVKAAGLWPTWTSLPMTGSPTHLVTVHVNFRIFEPAADLDQKFSILG